MKRLFYIILTLVSGVCSNVGAQSLTTMGTDFWVTNLTYRGSSNYGDSESGVLNFQIIPMRDCMVTITNPNTNWDTTVTALGSQTVYVDLLYSIRPFASEIIHDFVFHITSTDSIAVFATAGDVNFNEKSLVFTTSLIGDEYIVGTYGSASWGSELQVVAVEDSTEVLINPTANTLSGRQAGVPFSIMIEHAGQSLQVISQADQDFTGTLVKTTDGKPIAVFQGNSNSVVCDNDYPIYDNYFNGASVMFEQALPVSRWGRNFFVPHTSLNYPDKVIVVSSADSCKVYRNGSLVKTLNARQSYRYRVVDGNATDHIVTSKPAAVFLSPYTSWSTASGYRQSSIVTIAPLEWRTKDCYFNPQKYSDDWYLYGGNYWLHIVARSSDVGSIMLNGTTIANYFDAIPTDPQYSHAKYDLGIGTFRLYCDNCDGFTGYVVSKDLPACSFLIGSAPPEMKNCLIVKDVSYADTSDRITVCKGDTVTMIVKAKYTNDSVLWTFGDGTTGIGDTVRHVYHDGGIYPVTAIAYNSFGTLSIWTDTLRTYLRILNPDTTYRDSVVCGNQWEWEGTTYTDDVQISRLLENRKGCDSLAMINIRLVGPMRTVADSIIGCDSIMCGGKMYYYDDIVVFDTVASMDGCDSILTHAIFVNPSYDVVDEVTVYDTTVYTWIDGISYERSTNAPTFVLRGGNGCDSTIHLHLTVLPMPVEPIVDSSAIWVPNSFTPDENANRLFQVFSNDIISAEVSIFTRGGAHVCTFDGLTGFWDGSHNGHPCSQGSYVYLITYTTKAMPQYKQHKTGTVLLLR